MRTRILTGAVAMAVALAAVLAASPVPTAVLLGLLCLAGAHEAARLTGLPPLAGAATVVLSLSALAVASQSPLVLVTALAVCWSVGAVSLIVWKPNRMLAAAGLALWIACGAGAGMALQLQSLGSGSIFEPNLLLLVLVPLWAGDSMAYFVGKAWGQHSLAPNISPNKTVEGAAANLVACVVAAYALGTWLEVPVAASVAVGLSAGLFGQAGDLLQSRLKRASGAKDSGSLLPGHGGVLDRLDSFLFSSFPGMALLIWLAPGLFHVKQWPF
ncbi:MAG: phosphatidate cytidylyltransferase [Armatimonadetes bacterium]|nr:phosphatidate cytidylyltransferase [Armatimonadota bacterium]